VSPAHAEEFRRWARAEAGKPNTRRVVRRDLLRFARECGRFIVRRPNFAERMEAIRGAKGWHEVTYETQAGCLPVRLNPPIRCF